VQPHGRFSFSGARDASRFRRHLPSAWGWRLACQRFQPLDYRCRVRKAPAAIGDRKGRDRYGPPLNGLAEGVSGLVPEQMPEFRRPKNRPVLALDQAQSHRNGWGDARSSNFACGHGWSQPGLDAACIQSDTDVRSASVQKSDPMSSIVQVPAVGEQPPFTIQIGPSGLEQPALRPRRWIEQLVSQAVYSAALVVSGCRSAYELEQRFGPDAWVDSMSRSVWATGRRRCWDRLRRGEASVRSQLRRGDKDVVARLDAVSDASGLVGKILHLGLWRYLDPAALTTSELEPKSDQVASFAYELMLFPLAEAYVVRTFVQHLRQGLRGQETRYVALDGLWLRLRASHSDKHVAQYVLCYLLWLESASTLARDPVFGRIAASLYAYAAYYFGRIRVGPDVFDRAMRQLRVAQMAPDCCADLPAAYVDLGHIAHLDPIGPPVPGRRRGGWT
jgi:hypothetical protein